MDSSKQMPDLAGGARGRSLAGNDRNSGSGAGSRRILAELERGAAVPQRHADPCASWRWRIDGWTAGLCVLLAGMCLLAWLMHEQTFTPQTFKRQPRSTPVAADSSARHAGADSHVRDDSVHPGSGTRTGGHAQAAAIITTAPATAGTAPLAAPPAASTPATIFSLPASASASKIGALGTAASHATTIATASETTMKPVGPGANKVPPAISLADADVTLLTALVAHGDQAVSVAAGRSRDVVTRADDDQTAVLLARCKQVGLIEGMLCRSRICAGSWDSDPACRAPAD